MGHTAGVIRTQRRVGIFNCRAVLGKFAQDRMLDRLRLGLSDSLLVWALLSIDSRKMGCVAERTYDRFSNEILGIAFLLLPAYVRRM